MHGSIGPTPTVAEALRTKETENTQANPGSAGLLAAVEEADDEESHCNSRGGLYRVQKVVVEDAWTDT
ncbi:hypothetical protein HKX48_005591 [Thoreauomyces humboldtii]|nr:hypothetical protein HKX48_005591 [Thoreauomyces humboldtii]